jgi:hypothetical protein
MGYVACILLEDDEGCASLDFCFASQNVGNAGKQKSNRDPSNERHTHTMCYRESKGEHTLRFVNPFGKQKRTDMIIQDGRWCTNPKYANGLTR